MDPRPPALQSPPVAIDSPSKPKRRWVGAVIAVLALLALVGAAWYLVNRPAADAAGGGRPGGGSLVTVGMAVAKKADIPVLIDALGTVTPVTTITLRPQVSGVMTDVLFTEGQMVKKGDVLAHIDPRSYEQALMQAQGTRVRDQAQLEAARVTLERYRTLLGQDSIARQDVDTQAALVKQLEGTVITDKASEAAAKLNLDYTRVISPVSGRVGLRTVDPGNYVAGGATTGIVVITQITPIDVQFAVPQDRVPEIQARATKGAKLEVTALDRTRASTLDTGTFSTLDNVIDTTTGTVKAKARFDNAKGALFPNQFVNVRLLLRTISGAVVVPVTALRTAGTGNYVYVINEDRTVSMRAVKRGDSTVESVVITDGLKEGERVVTEGGDRLKDGSRVQLPGDAPRVRGARPGASAASGAAGGSAPPAVGSSAALAPMDVPKAARDGGVAPAPGVAKAPGAPVADATPATGAVPATGATPSLASPPLPNAEQRQRMLDAVKDDPEKLAQRKKFLEALDKGEPEALERWKKMSERRRENGGGSGGGGAS